VPLLSDQQAYGEFIAYGVRGTAAAYLNAFQPAWDEIAEICGEFIALEHARSGSAAVRGLHFAIGICIDPIDGEGLRISMGPTCAACGSSEVDYGDGIRNGQVDLPAATFDKFLAADAKQRRQLVYEALQEWQNRERGS